jgi:hypothetical protein
MQSPSGLVPNTNHFLIDLKGSQNMLVNVLFMKHLKLKLGAQKPEISV